MLSVLQKHKEKPRPCRTGAFLCRKEDALYNRAVVVLFTFLLYHRF
nr:MAG TPA: hypothetical protein [Caudoviricetes sp.]